MKKTTYQPPPSGRELRDLIRAVASGQGVPAAVALAFAELESDFKPQASGDLQWATKRPDKYRALVLDNPKFAQNPWRNDASRWHSYGLFGLLAPYHVHPNEDPAVLWDPLVNAQRGIAEIRRLLLRHNGDATAARLAYVGCGSNGARCADQYAQRVRERLWATLAKWKALEKAGVG